MSNKISVGESMTYCPEVVFKNTLVENAASVMKKYRIRHLPVVEKNKVIGVVSERDIKGKSDLSVEDVMVANPFKVVRGQLLAEVAQRMAEKKYGCAIIENDKGEVAGIFTTTDALFLLSRLLKDSEYAKLKLDEINWSRFPEYMI
ncbi:MAG: CBS domain-containing protein [Pseudomonadota bacterium]|nr:CBS domain-containing protein [Pseudomonadota bacterium]